MFANSVHLERYGLASSKGKRERRRCKPEFTRLEDRSLLSTAQAIPVHDLHAAALHIAPHQVQVSTPNGQLAIANDIHAEARFRFPRGSVRVNRHAVNVQFPGGSVTTNRGGTRVFFPGGSVIVTRGGTFVSWPGGSIFI